MNAESKSWSFVVGSKHGPRSLRWIITTSGNDVYINAENGRRWFHVSLHASGQWHIKLHNPPSGQSSMPVRLHKNDVPPEKFAVGLRILILGDDLRKASQVDLLGEPDLWIDRPEHGGAVEVAIMTWNYLQTKLPHGDEWPGQSSGSQLQMAYKYSAEDGKILGMLTRPLLADHPSVVQATQAKPNIEPIVLDSPERRMFSFTQTISGSSIFIVEYAID